MLTSSSSVASTVLSIDAARTCGYRDSLYFFRRNKELVKLTLSGVEKEHLIDIGRLSTTLKTRSVTMIAARNCYKLQGAKMLKSASTGLFSQLARRPRFPHVLLVASFSRTSSTVLPF